MSRRSRKIPLLALFSLLVFIAGLPGCIPSSERTWQPIETRKNFQTHTVEWPGETLPMIAQWYTGNKDNWKKIANANPNILADRLSAGDRILLPPELVTNTKKMPRDFISTFAGKAQPSKKKAPAGQPEDLKEEFQLYGPK